MIGLDDDLCGACGHSRVFHQIGRGTGVPVGTEYCDDRHSDPCACKGFVRAMAAPPGSKFNDDGFPDLGWLGTLLWRFLAGAAFYTHMKGPTYSTPEAIASAAAHYWMTPPVYTRRLDWLWSAEVAMRKADEQP